MKKARSFFNKLLVLTLAALLVCQPLHIVKAAEETDFVILEGAEENYTYEDGILQITSGSVKVANRKETASDERIVISGSAVVTLAGVHIDTAQGAALEVDDHAGTDVTLILENDNTLISRKREKAGLHKSRGQSGGIDTGTLLIKGEGSLYAQGGARAAGIGAGGYHGDVANLTIESGTITAQSGDSDAAGIGASVYGSVFDLIISGGVIKAQGEPGIGACRLSGANNAYITGGFVIANSYNGQTPGGGIVSLDQGATYTVRGSQHLSEDFEIGKDSAMIVTKDSELIIEPDAALSVKGILYNNGTIKGTIINDGVIYNNGVIERNPEGVVHVNPYLEVRNGTYSGEAKPGQRVQVQAALAPAGQKFKRWKVMYGSVQLDDEQSMDTSFVMSDECVVIEAQYVLLEAKITTKEGVVTMYEDVNEAMMQWQEEGSTLTLLQPIEYSLFFFDLPDQGILDLGGNRLSMMEWDRAKTLYIKNGAITLDLQNQEIREQTTLSFENVALSTREEGEFIIDNQGTIKDEGGLVVADNITIIGNKINYRIDWDSDADGVVDDTTYVSEGTVPVHAAGEKQSDEHFSYVFTGWSPTLSKAERAMTYTARFEKIPHIVHVTLPDASAYDIVYEGDTTLAYGDTFAFTLRLKPGYHKSDAFQVTAQGQVLQPDASGVYRFRVFADSAIRISGVADITAPAASVQINPVRIDCYEVSIHAWDEGSGIRSIVYMISDKPLSDSELRKWKQWNSYTDPIVIDTAGTSIVYARIEDQEGNVTYVHSDAIRIETQTDSVQSGTFVPTFSLYLWSGVISALALFMTVKKRRKS